MEDLHKKMKTFMLIMTWTAMGLYIEIPGPTLIDLKMRFDTNYEDISRSASAIGIGIFLGALIGGLLVDVLGYWKDILITFAQLQATVAVVTMPFVGSVSVLWFLFFNAGIAAGVVNVAGQRMLLEMWKEKSAAPMHAMHMGFGIGAVIAPLIANNFLAVLKFQSSNETSALETTNQSAAGTANQVLPYTILHGGEVYTVMEESRVELAYVTIGILVAVLALPFFINPCVKYWNIRRGNNNYVTMNEGSVKFSPKSLKEMINPATYTNGNFKYGLFVFVIILLYFTNLVGGEQLYGNFIRTFSVDELKFPRDEASYLDTAYWGSFTIGRFLGAVFSHWVPVNILFPLDILLNLLAITFLNIFSARSHASLWAFTAIVGLSISPLYPACMSFANTQIEIGGTVLTLIVFATGFGDMLYIWLAGHLYDSYGPKTILYAMQVSAVLVTIISTVFIIGGRFHGNRFTTSPGPTERRNNDIVMVEDMSFKETTPIHPKDKTSEQ